MEESLTIFNASDSWEGRGWALSNLGEVALALGNYAEAEARFTQALAIFRAIDLAEDESGAARFLGMLAHLRGDDQAALAHAEDALRVATVIGWVRGQGYALMVRGDALCGLGLLDAAETAYADARALREGLSEPALLLEAHAGLARVALLRADLAGALAHAEPILAHLAGGGLSGTDQPASVERICYQVLREAQDPRAPAVLAAAVGRLRERADRIADEGLRAVFLTGIAAHRALLAASAAG
jgi:tetratricopeptide (TPR) repeat protein